jgi:hypothetical protein
MWPSLACEGKKKVACVPAVVAVAGCILTVLMHACRPELWSRGSRLQEPEKYFESERPRSREMGGHVGGLYGVVQYMSFRVGQMEALKTGNRNKIPSQEIGLPAVEAGRSHNRRAKRMRERTDDRCELVVS